MSSNMSLCCGIQKFGWILLRGLIAGMVGISGQAAIFSWSGGGTDGNWSDAANWGFAGTPANGDTIIFSPSQPHLLNTNDIAGLILNQIWFVGAGGGYDIFGNIFTITNSIQATNTSGANIINNNINFSTADINITVSNALTLAGQLTGTTGFSKNGAGTLTFTGSLNNTYSGTTHVNDGLLQLEKSGAYGIGNGILTVGDSVGAAGSAVVREFGNYEIFEVSVVVNGDGLLDMAGNIDLLGPQVTLNDGGTINNSGTGVLNLLSGSTVADLSTNTSFCYINANVNVGTTTCTFTQTANGYLLMENDISGSAAITQSGPGQLYFLASNSFTGPVTVNGGLLVAYDPWALGTTNSGTTINEPGTLGLGNAINVVGEPLALNTVTGFDGAGAVWDYDGVICTWGGAVTLGADVSISVNSPGSLNFTGPITGPGGLTASGPGSVIYSGTNANTYAGPTVVNNGILLLEQSIVNSAIPGNVIVNNGGTLRLGTNEQIVNSADVFVNGGGLFDFGSFYEGIDTLHGTGNVTFGSGGYLYVGANNGTSTFDGLMSGPGYAGGYTVGKTGLGTFTLTANNTYQNGSDVFQGKFIINGSQPQSPVRYLASGATLAGGGVVGDISSDGIVAPGFAPGSPGILTCSNLAFISSGNFTVELKGPNPGTDYDQLSVRGTNALGNAGLTVTPAFTKTVSIGQQFVIITNDNSQPVMGQFIGLPDGTIFNASGYYFRINYNSGAADDVVLTLLGVPDKTVTLSAVALGWYDSSGLYNPGNYICGENNLPGDTNLYRDWFVFNAPVSASSIIHAELIVNSYSNSSPRGQETYLLRSVSTPVATLEAGGSGLTNIYNDLGDGAVYAVRNVSTDESFQRVIIPLNVKFINDITSASGGQIALGGSIVTLDPTNNHNQFLFGFSEGLSNDVQLRLTFGTATTLNAANTGWYNITGVHPAGNLNYVAGTPDGSTFFRDYFVFNLPAISGPLVNAQLLVNSYSNSSPSGQNTYQLYDVSTPLTALTNGAATATNTYADLGSGVLYGGRNVYNSEAGLPVGIPLDTAFVSAVHANSGGPIALGGVVSSLTPSSTNGYVFGFSQGNPGDVQLWLGFLSAPTVVPVFLSSRNLGNNQFQFTLSGTSGTSNEIQGSFDFQNWDYIGDLAMTNTTSTVTYTNNTTVPYRFFRAELMP